MENYLKIIDTVVFMAYNNGFCTPRKDVWDNYAVKERLMLYGYSDDEGRYFLNERGLEYVLNGLSRGAYDRIRRQDEMERLEIETQSFTKKKQKYTFWMATIGGGIAIVQAIVSIVKLMISVDI